MNKDKVFLIVGNYEEVITRPIDKPGIYYALNLARHSHVDDPVFFEGIRTKIADIVNECFTKELGPPAGLKRGHISNDLDGPVGWYTEEEMNSLYTKGINPITSRMGGKAYIWGVHYVDENLQVQPMYPMKGYPTVDQELLDILGIGLTAEQQAEIISNVDKLSIEELESILLQMAAVSRTFYSDVTRIRPQCHAFIEFTGLMNEFIKICRQTFYETGQDFTKANTHGTGTLVVHDFNIDYLQEKLNCIFDNCLHIEIKRIER